MKTYHIARLAATLIAGIAPLASAQVTPVRSSLDTRSSITLSVVDLDDEKTRSDDQATTLNTLGPHTTPVAISSADGVFTANTTGSALFADAASGTFSAGQTYEGNRAAGNVTAQSFTHSLFSTFEYDFALAGDGTIRLQGELTNSGPSFIGFTTLVSVFSEFMPGSGFTGPFFQEIFTDETTPGSTPIDITVPLTASSGSYRVEIRLGHSGNSGLDTPAEIGSTTIDWTITAPTACPADTNADGLLTPADFNAWILAFNTNAPECDQNADSQCTPSDFNAWILNFNAGC